MYPSALPLICAHLCCLGVMFAHFCCLSVVCARSHVLLECDVFSHVLSECRVCSRLPFLVLITSGLFGFCQYTIIVFGIWIAVIRISALGLHTVLLTIAGSPEVECFTDPLLGQSGRNCVSLGSNL